MTLGLAVLAGGLAGLSPALESLRVGLADPLRAAGRIGSGGVRPRVSARLLTTQLSISLALLVVLAMIGRAQYRVLE